jgi:4-amino-4-deoxy-L-arabinose transferase-like glycosyltransferase
MKKHLPFLSCLLIVAVLAGYRLSETPPTWMDEGIITQVARNMAISGSHAIQVAPGEYASGSFITTAYTTTVPVALSFSIFGFGIVQSRIVMALFIILLFVAVYLIIRKKDNLSIDWIVAATLLLIATFGPMYGHGRNVLGEVPGMAYMLLGLFMLKKIGEGNRAFGYYLAAGLFLGLAIVTKPIFIVLLPVVILALVLYRKRLFIDMKGVGLLGVALLAPIVIWLYVQFQGDTWEAALRLYSNPNAVQLGNLAYENFRRFFTEAQPLYTLALFILWTLSGIVRYVRTRNIEAHEAIAWGFSLLILLAYLRTAGFYRYFFQAEFLALVFVLSSVEKAIAGFAPRYRTVLLAFAGILIFFHLAQLPSSWVIANRTSTRSASLEKYIGALDPNDRVLFYQVPEAVNFLRPDHRNYYQYVKITDALEIGSSSRRVLQSGEVDAVVIHAEMKGDRQFSRYMKQEPFDRYVILRK